jgi:HEAT repeat protein
MAAALDKDTRLADQAKEAVRSLAEWAKPAIPLLIDQLEPMESRPLAVQALVKVGKSSIEQLVEGLKKGNPEVRIAVLDVLGQLGPSAKSALVAVNGRALNDPAPEVRKAAKDASKLIQK